MPTAAALGGERQCQVDRGRALADTALAGSDGDDVLDVREQLHASLDRVRNDLRDDVDADVGDAFDAAGGGDQRTPERFDLRLGRIAQLDVEGDVAAVDAHVAQLLGGDEIAAGLGVDDGLQGLEERGFVDGHEGGSEQRAEGGRSAGQSSAAPLRQCVLKMAG